MNLEQRIQQELVPEPENIRPKLRRVLLFILVVMGLTSAYQILMFNVVIPNKEIDWERSSIEQAQEFDKQGRRFAVLVMLADDLGESSQPLPVFDDESVRKEFNLLRLVPLLVAIESGNDSQQAWFKEQEFQKLPALMLYAAGRQEPFVLNADELDAQSLAKTLNEIRYQRYEP